MAFSGALTITDLDDFLTPSQACIIPVRGPKKSANDDDGPTEIQIDDNNNYYEVSTYSTSAAGPSSGQSRAQEKKALEKAEINLNDCLACSGCITSTESMLITLQSHNEVLSFISDSTEPTESSSSTPRIPVLSISPQTLASLSASYSSSSGRPPIPLLSLLRRIRSFLAQDSKGGWRVWDTTFARHVSLRESQVEFEERKEWARRDKGKAVDRNPALPEPAGLPMLASACPGWVCYAEKAQGDMLPLMSGARSSQAVIGGLVKTWFSTKMGIKPDQIYHVTAMPCYDKKLEASRSDFYSSLYSTRDVDCVLTTGELDLLLADLGFSPFDPAPGESEAASTDNNDLLASPWPELLLHQGSSSGSYLGTLMTSIASSHPRPTKVTSRQIRGSTDNVEYLLEDAITGEVIFKGAKCYGFRNLQNLVRKVGKETGIIKGRAGANKLSAAIAARRKKARTGQGPVVTPETHGTPGENGGEIAVARDEKKLDFVEVMACPGGCVNGGGQMKPVTAAPTLIINGTEPMEVDEEGYTRPIPVEGIEKPPAAGGAEEGMRWSTKEWVEKVEAIYWTGLPTPPASPTISAQKLDMEDFAGVRGADGKRLAEADVLAEQIVRDVVGDDAAQRWEFLRTRYRKVESDVLEGGVTGVTHEAVKW